MTDVRTPEMYLHEGTIGSDGKHCDSARCWCWDEFAATVEARTLDKRCPECDNGQYCGIGPCPKCHPEAVTSNELVTSLRSARVCNTLGHKMLMHRAADEIERLVRERDHYKSEADNLRGLWNDPNHLALLEGRENAAKGYAPKRSAPETFCECPPNCQGPDHTSKLCRAESSEKRQETRNDES